MPIDWGNRETIFRLLAAAFAAIGKEGVSKFKHPTIIESARSMLLPS